MATPVYPSTSSATRTATARRPNRGSLRRRVAVAAALLAGCASSDAPSETTAPTETAGTATHAEPHWAQWDADTFAQAKADDRIILINVVASWCHWCHVMEEKTYANPEVAELLAAQFVTIRIDSDARPDIAERYRAWGWPATAVLSPDARPVLELRGYQSPAKFTKLLRELVAQRDAGTLERRAPPPKAAPEKTAVAQRRAAAVAQLDGYFDAKAGGWGKVQKYPFAQPVEHALSREPLHGATEWTAAAMQTLRGTTALIDPVWGGVYQYSLRGDWDHPHYEKITAIQAGAIENFAWAARVQADSAQGAAAWLAHADKVIDYMNTFMRAENGGYFTSQDADLRLEGEPPVVGLDYYALSDAKRRELGIPRIDTQVYADLNGLMVRALAERYVAGDTQAGLDDARTTAERLLQTHRDPNGAFRHDSADASDGLRYLRDQAAMAWGLLALYNATAEPRWLQEAQRSADFMLDALQDDAGGGFWAHTPDPEARGVFSERRKPLEENALAARVLLRLHRALDGDGSIPTPYRAAAEATLLAISSPEAVKKEGRIIGTYALALEDAEMPTVDITVVGERDDPKTAALHRAALRYLEPRATVEWSAPGERYPDTGKPAVYLCTANSCSAPLRDPATFSEKADAVLAVSLPPVP